MDYKKENLKKLEEFKEDLRLHPYPAKGVRSHYFDYIDVLYIIKKKLEDNERIRDYDLLLLRSAPVSSETMLKALDLIWCK